MNEPVKIDAEFQSLIPPLSDDEFKQLEENCKRDGILDNLKAWRGILIDGHNRYKIAMKWDMPYAVDEMYFKSRDEVVRWIILNQFGRRNLSAYDRSVLALKLKPMIREKAKETQGNRNDICQKSDKSTDTKKELAKVAGVSHDTIHKVETIETSGNEEVKQAVKSGEISINNGYQQIMRERTPEPPKRSSLVHEAKQRHAEFEEKKAEGVVNIQDARQDKEDQKQIARELYKDLMSLTTKGYWIGALNNSFSFGLLKDVVTDKDRMRDRIQKLMIVLQKTLEVLS